MLFIPLWKVDAGRRVVIARLDETPDRSGMVLDYDSSKPAFQEWSDSMRKATDGQSLGNVREMHGLKAIGKVTRLDFFDGLKAIEFEIEVVDDDAMAKVEAGILTGISQGGKYGRRWHDGAHIRYTAGKVNELSLVDYPCNPAGTFAMVKADGAEVQVAIAAPGDDTMARYVANLLVDAGDLQEYRDILTAQPAAMLKALFADGGPGGMQQRDFDAGERERLTQIGEAMADGSFPISAAADIAGAVRAVGHAGDQNMVKAWIAERAKALDATADLPADWEGSTKQDDMQKGLSQISRFADLIQSLTWLVDDATWEAAGEADGSKIPARLAAWVKTGAAILADMVTEETAEALAALQAAVDAIPSAAMEHAAKPDDMVKAGARNSKADLGHIQVIHDHAMALGACCAGTEGGTLPSMVKIAGDLASVRMQLDEAIVEKDRMQKRIAQLEGEPVPGGPRLKNVVVGKSDDARQSAGAKSEAQADLDAINAMPEGPEKLAALVRHSMKFS